MPRGGKRVSPVERCDLRRGAGLAYGGGMGNLVMLVFVAIGFYILYWTIRLAVRHALEEADER
ncbi:hypothetical protein GCM10029992_43350 [Glycomyces albus]